MKRIITILVLVCAVLKCMAQELTSGGNAEGTVFWTDTVHLHDYSIVESGKNGHMFIFPQNTIKLGKRNNRYWNKANVVIYAGDDFVDNLLRECVRSGYVKGDSGPFNRTVYDSICNAIWPGGCEYLYKNKVFFPPFSRKDLLFDSDTLKYKATFFRVFRVRGDVYNKLTCNCIDCEIRPIKFRKSKKFYTVYCPIR